MSNEKIEAYSCGAQTKFDTIAPSTLRAGHSLRGTYCEKYFEITNLSFPLALLNKNALDFQRLENT